MPWYLFTGPNPAIGTPDPFAPEHYTYVGDEPPPIRNNSCVMCAIQTRDSCGLPIITTALHSEIIEAIMNKASSKNVLLRFC